MAETKSATHPRLAGLTQLGVSGGGGAAPSPSAVNSYRVSSVIDLLYRHVQGIRKSDHNEFFNLCIALARSIDFAIAYNEVPSRATELPLLLKQLCQDTKDIYLKAAVMVLMISIKSACRSGWFPIEDSEELNNVTKEVASSFSVAEFSTVPSSSHPVVSTVMARFYPKLRMGHVFAFIEVKPGFDVYVADFQLSKDFKPSPGDKISLFVAQTDNIETSACLVSPAKVNFLLNGKGVERRINSNVDPGPQIPTVVNSFLKYGTNFLQAVGDFNGNHIVAVAIMKQNSNTDISALQDHEEQPKAVDSDSDILEGASRISLICPISHQRIVTPVKGHLCNHMQCFDYNSYVEINSRKPSWRCPCCNQHACFTEIRIDQKMVKILQEVAPNISNIIISSDGSWNAVTGSDDTVEKPRIDIPSLGEDEPPKGPQPPDILDLTQIDDAVDLTKTGGTEDMKNVVHRQVVSQNTGHANAQAQPNAQHQFGNPSASNEFGRPPWVMPGHVTQIPAPVQDPNSGIHQSSRNGDNNFIPSTLPAISQTSATGIPVPLSSLAVQQTLRQAMESFSQNNFLPARSSSPAASIMPTTHSTPSPTPMYQQNFRNSFSTASQPTPAAPIITSAPHANPRHASSVNLPPYPQQHVQQNPFQLQLIAAANRTAQMSAGMMRGSPSFPRNLETPNLPSPEDLRATTLTASQPANTRTETYDPNDRNWRPTARMRGALSGQAYADALYQHITLARQQVQAPRAIPNTFYHQTNAPAQVQTSAGVSQAVEPSDTILIPDPFVDSNGML
ncbi:E4 SUMO-protein ligase PIAL2 isoform X2 [Andrographis paniculata]|uniref:E4 SUMO-protein ligase PIAL2 isoform X2 n=1 Tax=Andrographis paniculata TaxID=175694 RepID=UPI0021E8BD8B|nr:E4 SUMO-protein ligase PIAL2 isoform X2 [Andrographis paniculata]